MNQIDVLYSQIDRDTAELIGRLVAANGVPTSQLKAYHLAEKIYPEIMEMRLQAFVAQSRRLVDEGGLGLKVAQIRPYPFRVLQDVIEESAGLKPGKKMATEVRYLDPESQRALIKRVAPFMAADDPEVREVVASRIAATAARHVKQASRNVVVDTAAHNRMRWARRGTGRETCTFCTMLIGRGAVYAEKTASFESHNHCDCRAVLVPDRMQDWDGKAEADEIYRLWRSVNGTIPVGTEGRNAMAIRKFDKVYKEINGGLVTYGH